MKELKEVRSPARAVALVFCIVALVSVALAATHQYHEDFTNKQYCDTLHTTALWDTDAGELRLPPFELTLAGSYSTPGVPFGVRVAGDYAYVVEGTSGLQVIDISDPTTPTLAGSYDTQYYAFGLAIAGDYAYVAVGPAGLQVIDISNPMLPTLARSFDTGGTADRVAIAGDYAYVATWNTGLQVINISDPTLPTLAGSYNTPLSARDVAIAGDYAYVADDETGLLVISISNPADPTLVGSYDTPGRASDVAIAGDYAYVADFLSGLQVIDISDPTLPTLAGSYDTPDQAREVVIGGNYAYVADNTSGLLMIDISDPTLPTLAGSYDTPGRADDVVVSGEYAYVADWMSFSLQVIKIADSIPPTLAGSYDTPDYAYDVAIAGDYAYLVDLLSGLQVINITNPTTPTIAGSYDTPGDARDIAISGDYAYVADDSHGLQVIDIASPMLPTVAGNYVTPAEARGVAIAGDYAYLACDQSGLQVINISNPATPTLAGSYNTPGYAIGVAISGDRAYVADYTYGLQVINISDPTVPTFAGSYNTPGGSYGVAIAGDFAYVADGSSLQVIDISDPATPSYAGSYATPGDALGITVEGDLAYIGDFTSGLQVIDISDPTSPTLAGTHDTPGEARGVAFAGDYVYLADYGFGLQVIQVYQRLVDPLGNTAHSLSIGSPVNDVVKVKLASVETGTIGWELSADGGTNWQTTQSDGSWQIIKNPGTDLMWRSTLTYSEPTVNPTCTSLDIEWVERCELGLPVVYVDQDASGAETGQSWTDAFTDLQDALVLVVGCEDATEIWVADGTYYPTSDTDRWMTFELGNNVGIYGGFAGTETQRSERDWLANQTILSGDIGVVGVHTDNSYHVTWGSATDSTAIIDGFTITRGYANGTVGFPDGAGMFIAGGSPTVSNIIFSNNECTYYGGALLNYNSSHPRLTNVVFWNNSATRDGGAVQNRNYSNPTYVNVTFSGNVAANGGAMHNFRSSNPKIINAVFWGNSATSGIAEIQNELSSTPVISHSLVGGSGGSAAWDGSYGDDGGNNIDIDPLFVDQSAGNLRLTGGSPAANAGDNSVAGLPATDLDGNPRISEGVVDMGAYEYPAVVVSAFPSPLVFGQAPVNETTCNTIYVVNDGGSTCTIAGIYGCDTSPFSLDTTMTAHALAPGDTTEIVVCVTPTTHGPHTSAVTIVSDAWNSPLTVLTRLEIVTAIGSSNIPKPFGIVAVSPNPFNPTTTVHFTLPAAMPVMAEIWSVKGERVRVLADEKLFGPGDNRIAWDGRTDRGTVAASGVYFIRLKTRLGAKITRAVLLK